MEPFCSDCKYYDQEYYMENGKIMRFPSGLCKRTECPRRKIPENSCRYFIPREIEREEELIIRRQKLLAEIIELTEYLGKISVLADIARHIQEILKGKD